jgi:ATPase subunit of ABC transporter with duplicated ATPase domains
MRHPGPPPHALRRNVPPVELTGTGLIIVLCFIFSNLPVGVRAGTASFKQLDKKPGRSQHHAARRQRRLRRGAGLLHGADRADVAGHGDKGHARATMDPVGLAGYDTTLPSELSGGQQQRSALARCLVLEPSVLLFDEPLSNLDARLRRSMREEIRALQQRLGLTVAYVTHDQSEAWR